MTAGGHKKYLFETDFSPEADIKAQQEAQAKVESEAKHEQAEAEAIAEAPPTFSEEDLERARNEGFEAGHTEATRDLTSALEQRLVNTMDAINAQVTNLFEAYARDKEEHSRDAVAVATVIVRKLFPALNMDKAMAEIEHMIIEAMQRTSGSPSLIVRVTPDIKEAVEAKAEDLTALHGRDGTVSVMADAKLLEGDAAIEWDGGGMFRHSALMWQEIDEIIERNLGTERASNIAQSQQPQEQEGAPETSQEVVNDASVEDNKDETAESLAEPPVMTAPPVETGEQQGFAPMEDAPDAEDDTPALTPPDGVDEAEMDRVGDETPKKPENSG